MNYLNKQTAKLLNVGDTIHIVSQTLDVTGTIVWKEPSGLGIGCSDGVRVGVFFNEANKYKFEIV